MVNRNVIVIRLSKAKEYINYLNDIKKCSKNEYLKNPIFYGAAERFLHLTIESIIDMSNHIISDSNYRKPESNRDIFEVLYENEIIDFNLKENLSDMASFRNILVHDYLKLDRAIVYDILHSNLKDIQAFIDIIINYI
ncbi:MAG: type VII toxin-antitoxin system HepT family RNase toxin [Senegalia sp. (in: firmicutes)]|uniref:type VII toxin-antitoxin system HepT family RNase toxin n=1 Tax=Senegalia sp. (in: firmicutes) TaxID=1924098 RepID=UPI003F9BB13D